MLQGAGARVRPREQPDDVDMLPAHHAEFFEGVEDKPGEVLIMVVEVLVVSWTL